MVILAARYASLSRKSLTTGVVTASDRGIRISLEVRRLSMFYICGSDARVNDLDAFSFQIEYHLEETSCIYR